MRRLWEEENVTHEGTFYTCHNVTVTPKPFLEPSTPVWIGGRSPAAARRVGRVGDGWLVSSATPAEIKEGRDIVFSTAAEFEREIEEDHIGVLLGYYISDDVEEATAMAYDYVTRHRPRCPLHRVQRRWRRRAGGPDHPELHRCRSTEVRGAAPLPRRGGPSANWK